MDAVKSPNLIYGKEYKGHTKNKGISLEMLLLALLIHYTTELGNRCRLLTCYTISKSQHPFHYQELASINVGGTHSTHVIDQSLHPLGLGDFTASIPLLNKIGNHNRL